MVLGENEDDSISDDDVTNVNCYSGSSVAFE